MGGTTRR
jgi:hypothetical protein